MCPTKRLISGKEVVTSKAEPSGWHRRDPAWLRHNELRQEPEALVLIDFSQWREEQRNSTFVWRSALIAQKLAGHPLTSIPVVEFKITLDLQGAWQDGVRQVVETLESQRSHAAQALHILSQVSLSFAVALLLLFVGPVAVIQTQDFISQALAPEQNQPTNIALPVVENTPTPEPIITSEEDVFSIEIPDLDIKSNITANVDPGSEKSYSAALKKGIAHAAGTGLPDQLEKNKTIYLFAHSTDAPWNIARYNAQFYGLKDAQEGQQIRVRFWGEDRYYKIVKTEIVAATDTTYLQPQTEKEQLILQTCYPPGTAWKRLIVIAEPIS